jgi:hypothetical protein
MWVSLFSVVAALAVSFAVGAVILESQGHKASS